MNTSTTSQYGPKYYRRGNIEVWDFVRDQQLNFHLGNAIKYICRAGHKDSAIEDLTKAIHYLENEREQLQAQRQRVQEEVRTTSGTDDFLLRTAAEFDR